MLQKHVISPFFLLVGVFLFLVSLPFVSALAYGGVGGQPAYYRSEEPKSKNIFVHTLVPGQVQAEGVVLYNMSSSGDEKVILVSAVDTVHSSDGGVACAQVQDIQKRVGTWITLEKNEVVLPPEAEEMVPFTITVPENVVPGEYNGCIVIEEQQQEERGAGLSLSTRIGLRVALTVPGALQREIVEPTVVMSTLEDGGYTFQISGRNTGNVSVDTNLALTVRSLMTGLVYARQGGGYPVYREKTQRWNFGIEKPFWGGPYLVTTTLSYDSTADGVYDVVLKAPNIFLLVMPDSLALGIEIGVIFLLVFSFFMYRSRRRRRMAQKKGVGMNRRSVSRSSSGRDRPRPVSRPRSRRARREH